jgi:hypothetical protein
MHAVTVVDDRGRLRDLLLSVAGDRIIHRAIIDIGPQAPHGANLPGEIEPASVTQTRADAEEQIRVFLGSVFQQPVECLHL